MAMLTGRSWSRPRPFNEPVSRTVARCTSKISAHVKRYEVIRVEDRGNTDPDEDEAVRRDTALVGEEKDDHRGDESTEECADRRAQPPLR